MEGCRDGCRVAGGGRGRGKLKLISRPPQLSTVFGELRHAYMWLIEPGEEGRQVGVGVCSVFEVSVYLAVGGLNIRFFFYSDT